MAVVTPVKHTRSLPEVTLKSKLLVTWNNKECLKFLIYFVDLQSFAKIITTRRSSSKEIRMNNSNDDDDYDETPHEKEQNKVADFWTGAILFGILFL